ncbi:hypothetical protein Poly30_51670 [Planctomycetes bacterium Poly30]|uniref:DUF2339 domain-containing protein n=1 Tax=Saltatorellus ferox TaxID=2528018 RepID=A0A518EZV7_9BACT|nr:hypothetical protein Poly30_51670 [Planctomycetes bacterium Poly30]
MLPSIILLLVFLFVGGGLLALHVLERLKGLDRQIDALRRKLERLEDQPRVERLHDAAPSEITAVALVSEPTRDHVEELEGQLVDEPVEVVQGTSAAPIRPVAPTRQAAPTATTATAGIDWERWIGIRGAAVVGSIALVLAGLFFVQVAIERGWLGPAARDLLAFGVGALALLAHGPLRVRKLVVLADSVAGAGTVLMYGGAWAAARLHGLVSPPLALVVMAATTGAALLLSFRRNAPILASFALIGGFATPVLLGTLDRSSTATLFGYVLILDLALLALSRVRGWVAVVPAALVGTVALQILWSEKNAADPASLWTIALIVASSAVLFTLAIVGQGPSPGKRSERDELDAWSLVIALGAPFVLLARQFVVHLPPGTSVWTIAALAGVLICAAATATLRFRTALYFVGCALASAVLLGLFQSVMGTQLATPGVGWSGNPDFDRWAICTLLLAILLSALALRIERKELVQGGKRSWAAAGPYAFALLSAFPIALIAKEGQETADGAFIGLIGLLVLMGCHAARFAGGGHLPGAILGLLSGCTVAMYQQPRFGFQGFADPWFWSLPAFGLACFGFSHLLRSVRDGRFAASLSAVAAFVALPALVDAIDRVGHAPVTGLLLARASVGVIALAVAWPILEEEHSFAPRLRHLVLILGAIGVAVLLADLIEKTEDPWRYAYLRPTHPSVSLGALAAVLSALPFAAAVRARRAFRASAALTRRQAIGVRSISWITALPLLYLLRAPGPLGAMLWASSYGDPVTADAFLDGPLRQALLVGGALVAVLVGALHDRVDRRSALGPLAVAAILASAVLARELSFQATIATTALAAGSIALLARRAALGSLVQMASVLVLISAVGLLFLTFVAGRFLATAALLPLQLTIDFGFVLAGAWASSVALGRLRSDEIALVEPTDSIAALQYATGAGILALLFGWMNAAVLNHFAAPGEAIRLVNERLQARDLSLSISWGVFASGLLAWGMVRRSAAIRWTSLCLFIAFILKVFLYDLGALTGLSRVASFLGLAVALLGVSLLYARVLGTEEAKVDNLLDHDAA